jgi:hypothetical protein
MCYNAEVSIQTWYFAVFGFIVGLLSGFPLSKLLFAIVFSSMQLVEYYLWKNINNPEKNRFYSMIGHWILNFEPLFALFLIQNIQIMTFLIVFYILFISIYTLLYHHKIKYYTNIGQNGHLNWQFTNNIGRFYGFIWFSLFFFGIFMSKDIVFILGGIFTLFYSYIKENGKNTFTSIWCYLSNIVWIYVILWAIFTQFKIIKK